MYDILMSRMTEELFWQLSPILCVSYLIDSYTYLYIMTINNKYDSSIYYFVVCSREYLYYAIYTREYNLTRRNAMYWERALVRLVARGGSPTRPSSIPGIGHGRLTVGTVLPSIPIMCLSSNHKWIMTRPSSTESVDSGDLKKDAI